MKSLWPTETLSQMKSILFLSSLKKLWQQFRSSKGGTAVVWGGASLYCLTMGGPPPQQLGSQETTTFNDLPQISSRKETKLLSNSPNRIVFNYVERTWLMDSESSVVTIDIQTQNTRIGMWGWQSCFRLGLGLSRRGGPSNHSDWCLACK